MIRPCVSLLALVCFAGCASSKATFQVAVKNGTNDPLSVGLVKVGGRVEPGWDGPEHIVIHAPMYADRKWGALVEPGQSITLGPQTGRFVQGTRAILRVYAADVTVDELMGYTKTDSARLDVSILPGPSAYVIERDDAGGIRHRPVQPGPTGTAQR
jgi:hypothetical protein